MSGMFDRLKATLEHELGFALKTKEKVLPSGVAEEILVKMLGHLREPNKAMWMAGFRASPNREQRLQIASNDSWTRAGVIAPYQAMVDQILADAPGQGKKDAA
jgi:hypothetical protein